MKTHFSLCLSLLLILGVVSCSKAEVAVTSVKVSPSTITLTEGDTETLSCTVSPSDATNKTVHWSSGNASVATVNDGIVTAVAPGETFVSAKTDDGGMESRCKVTVNAKVIPVESVTLDKSSVEIKLGETYKLSATILPENATDKSVSWESSNVSVAEIVDGEITAVEIGKATITVTSSNPGITAKCNVEVVPNPEIEYYPGTTLLPIKVGDIVWAPVNCGYEANEYPYGKLYQWGRAQGCGYNEYEMAPETEIQALKEAEFKDGLNSKLNDDDFNSYFYTTGGDWYADDSSKMLTKWPVNTSDDGYLAAKVADPCPDGWRVSTLEELDKLAGGNGTGTSNLKQLTDVVREDGQRGHYFNGTTKPNKLKTGSTTKYEGVFFPEAGFRHGSSGTTMMRDGFAYYWCSTKSSRGSVRALYFSRSTVFFDTPGRSFGCAVRCVKK